MFLPREAAWYLEGPVFDLSFHCHLGWIPGIQRVAQNPQHPNTLIKIAKKNYYLWYLFFSGVWFHFSTEISQKLVYQWEVYKAWTAR